ncbi:MAG: hypothetical protein GC190_11230 [Alphaproteobacteria bacterium]|nr:hypothetical protein [Alphaproteobacteria bacterium]
MTSLFGGNDDDAPAKARAEAEAATVWELTIHAGRYGVMLDQARTILKLPEPDSAPTDGPPVAGESLAERQALAAQQVRVANEFYADAARACSRRRTPAKLRAIACEHKEGVPVELQRPADLDVAALSARNEALDKVVLPWWDAACGSAPKPRGEDAEPICPME